MSDLKLWFFKTKTCAPCGAYLPKAQAVADALQIPMEVIDAEAKGSQGKVMACGISGVPAVALVSNNVPVAIVSGSDDAKLRSVLEMVLAD